MQDDSETGGYQEPLYQRVVRILSHEITEGAWPVGARLPTEASLQRRFKASRHTIREALRQLREAGIVTSRQGSGTVVLRTTEPRRYVHSASSLSELLQYASATRLNILESGMVTADAALAIRLDCSPGRQWLRVAGLRETTGMAAPICWVEVFIHDRHAGIAEALPGHQSSIYSLIEQAAGERIAEVRQTIRSGRLEPETCAQLDVAPDSPALEIERIYLSSRQKVLEVAFSTYPLERFSHSMVIRRENG